MSSTNSAARRVVERYLRPLASDEAPATIVCDLYLRLSDGRGENDSFEDRKATLCDLADERGWVVGRVVVENDLSANGNASAFKHRKVQLPDGRVGLRVIRPGFRSILDDFAANRAQAILAEDLDRAMRDPRDGEDLIECVLLYGIKADSLSGRLRFTGAPGSNELDEEIQRARAYVNAAASYSMDLRRRAKNGRRRGAKRGRWGGGRRPYGFTPVPRPSSTHQNTELEVCEDEAEVVRWCADKLLSGVSLRMLAQDLNRREIPTVTGVPWSAKALRDILLRELNAGIIIYDGMDTGVRLAGEPILPQDIWEAVVAKLTDPSRVTLGGMAPRWLGSALYLCVCGSTMEIQSGGTTTGRAPTYRCARKGGTGDVHVRRNAVQLDGYVASLLIERLSRSDAIELFREAEQQSQPTDLAGLRQEATALRARKKWLAAQLGAGEIDPADYATAREANQARLEKIEAQLARVSDRSPLAGLVGADDMHAAWNALCLGQQRTILAKLLTVTILPATVRKDTRVLSRDRIRKDWHV